MKPVIKVHGLESHAGVSGTPKSSWLLDDQTSAAGAVCDRIQAGGEGHAFADHHQVVVPFFADRWLTSCLSLSNGVRTLKVPDCCPYAGRQV